ncbi:MAG: PEGA domain-containing protein [Pseudomonadota bacterium]
MTVRVDWPAQRLIVGEVEPAPLPATQEPVLPAASAPAPAPPPPAGDLFVAADVEGATVLLDGEESGRTPLLLKAVPEGDHRLDLRTPCARSHQDVQVVRDVVTRAELVLERGKGAMNVTSLPSRASVWLDGVEVGFSPLQLEVECGSHAVEVRSVGFLPEARTLDVPAFETVPVAVELDAERFGRLSVLPTPVEATVTLDGVVLGTGPRTVDPVSAGPHDLTVSAAGYQADGRAVDVAPDTVTRVEVTLPPVAPPNRVPWGRIVLDSAPAAGGIALGVLALGAHREARDAYDRFLAVDSDQEAARIWDEEVAPARDRSVVEGIAAGVLLLGSGVLWWTTDFTLVIGPGAARLEASW